MANRILDNRLQYQVRNARVERLRRDRQPHRQTVLEANLFDLQVTLQGIQFLPQRNFLLADVL